MGDYNYAVNPSARAVSPLEFHAASQSLFFGAMQDELAGGGAKQQQPQSASSNAAQEAGQEPDYAPRKPTKDEAETNGGGASNACDKKTSTSPLHLGGFVDQQQPSSGAATSSFWSSEDPGGFMQGMPALNGTQLAFQNFPPNPFASMQMQPPQRRPLAGFPRQPAQSSVYAGSWSAPRQGPQQAPASTWSSGGPPSQPPGLSPWSSLHQRRGPVAVNPISPLKKTGQQSGALVISPSRFRRSTSFPGKGYPGHPASLGPNLTFEITGAEDSRDVNSLMNFQEIMEGGNMVYYGKVTRERLLAANQSPLDTMRVGFEPCLNDMMRYNGDSQDHLKARSYGRRRAGHERGFQG